VEWSPHQNTLAAPQACAHADSRQAEKKKRVPAQQLVAIYRIELYMEYLPSLRGGMAGLVLLSVTHVVARNIGTCLEGGREGGSRPPLFGGHGPGGSQAPQEQKGALGLAPGKRPPSPFLRASLPAVASGDFSCKMTLGRATKVESNTFFFERGWFGASPKHGPLHHMEAWAAGLAPWEQRANTPSVPAGCRSCLGYWCYLK
jgi:hypothetical protein